MDDKIKNLAEQLYEDIQEIRKSSVETRKRVGIEVMALNAICNADRLLNKRS